MEENLEPYIEERINNSMTKFKKSKKWKKYSRKFNNIYEKLYDELQLNYQKELEDLYAIFSDLSAQEQYLVYKVGFVDGINLREEIRG